MTEPITPDEEPLTELFDATIPTVSLVGKAANGHSFILAKADERGLFDPAFVRDLIKTAEPEPTEQERITMIGTPAAMAELIHKAAQRAAGEHVEKATISTADLNDKPDSDFAYIEPGGTKDDTGKTTPRSKRHFYIGDADHVRDALSRAPQSPFGDKAMPKITAAAKKFGIDADVTKADTEDLDVTEVLAEPENDAPGADTMPGSPAWEAVDAATARKWTAILSRAKNAIGVMASREQVEAASDNGGPDDAENAFDLQDAQCAIDYAIGVLAPFAVGEQAEADLGDELQQVGKAAAGIDVDALDVLEAFGSVVKAGRALSAANEATLREAAQAIEKVLASLPSPEPDDGQPVAKRKEADMATAPNTNAVDDGSATKAENLPADVAKAKGDPQTAVYDAKGNLMGVMDPADLIPVAAPTPPEGGGDTQKAEDAPAEPAAAPAAPAAPAEDAAQIPGTDTVAAPAPTPDDDVAKSVDADTDPVAKAAKDAVQQAVRDALDPLTEALAPLAKKLDDNAEIADVVKNLQEQIEIIKQMPDDRKAIALNGATGTPGALSRDGHADDLAELRKQIDEATDTAQRDELRKQMFFAEAKARFTR